VAADGADAADAGTGLPVPPELWRGVHPDHEEWIDSGRFAVELLCRVLDREDLDGIAVLDVGCGTKVVKALLDDRRPIGHYTGVDVAPGVIGWLDAHVSDPRFDFQLLEARNDLYPRNGPPLAEVSELPVGGATFDIACLFSVFTHLDPPDFAAMLRLLRPCVRPGGRLVFSAFLDDAEHPTWLAQRLEAALSGDDPELRRRAEAAVAEALEVDRRFVDEVPERPLLVARYQRDYALELVEAAGWRVISVNPPEQFIQHSIVCEPA